MIEIHSPIRLITKYETICYIIGEIKQVHCEKIDKGNGNLKLLVVPKNGKSGFYLPQ
jgi:hypothetical protein